MNWKIISSEYLFKDLWFTIRKDVCQKPNGGVVNPYYVYEFPEWVTAVALTEDGKFIFEKQYRHALGQTMMEIPGGCVDEGDANLQEAIARELKEETGYVFSKYEYLGKVSSNPSTNSNMMHYFLATGGRKVEEQTLDQHEEIEVQIGRAHV